MFGNTNRYGKEVECKYIEKRQLKQTQREIWWKPIYQTNWKRLEDVMQSVYAILHFASSVKYVGNETMYGSNYELVGVIKVLKLGIIELNDPKREHI